MRFSPQEIETARELRRLGLPWEPLPGHYVYDRNGFSIRSSPFQDRVYFILNYDYFMRLAGGVARFMEIMLWLPTWHDAREILRSLGVGDEEVAADLQERRAIESQQELIGLYEIIAKTLRQRSGAACHEAAASST